MANAVTFKRYKKDEASYYVYSDGRLVGLVSRRENWTVRGNRVDWLATRRGVVVGSGETRKSAAALIS